MCARHGVSPRWSGSVRTTLFSMAEILPAGHVIRAGTSADVDACVALWVEACAVRDGRALPGVAERARPKFDRAESWFVSTGPDGAVAGVTVTTPPGSGIATDPTDACVVGLLAVAPAAQGGGLGGRLLATVTADLAHRGQVRAVLHVLVDNRPAVRLYESQGWVPWGEVFPHVLLGLPVQTYTLDLARERGAVPVIA